MIFNNRFTAGNLLADKLEIYKNDKELLVLSVPRGGVVVGSQIAYHLDAPHIAIVVKKLSAPHNKELAIGAISSDGSKIVRWDLLSKIGISKEYLTNEVLSKKKAIKILERKLQGNDLSSEIIKFKKYVLVDDGIATGATILAAIRQMKSIKMVGEKERMAGLILAIPVIAKEVYNKLSSEVEEIVSLDIPDNLISVGQFYKDFSQVSDEEVIRLLENKI